MSRKKDEKEAEGFFFHWDGGKNGFKISCDLLSEFCLLNFWSFVRYQNTRSD